MPRFQVPLTAKDVQVTASNLGDAESYARADARDFRGLWIWEPLGSPSVELEPTLECTTKECADLLTEFSVFCTAKPPTGEEGLYTFDLTVTPIVDASDETEACQIALELYGMSPAIHPQGGPTAMSVSRRCVFFKAVDGQWYCTLGDEEYAYEDHECTTYGPFPSEEEADQYVSRNFSNPGGSCSDDSGKAPVPANAVSPRQRSTLYSTRFR
jgi:hypothetical protein